MPAQAITVGGSGLCLCTGGNYADGPTDENGSTTFTGVFRGTGCATSLSVRADGVDIGTVPVRVNSPDNGPVGCSVSGSDESIIQSFGSQVGDASYNVCVDLNEDGHVDLADFALFLSHMSAICAH